VALEELGGQVTRVLIESVQDGTFFATLHLEQAGLEMVLDARPSDAIALALRFQAPIAVRDDVWDLASQESPLDEDAVLEGRETSARDVLTQALQEAVAAERYEEAARLRDELRKLPGDN
jgi:bifunctional DNase/RNase